MNHKESDRKRIHIHIGTDKTGSTALQSFVFRNSAVLKQKGVDVVPSKYIHHGTILDELKAGGKSLLSDAVQYINQSKSPAFLLTFEGFYLLGSEQLKDFLSAFAEFDINVILYVRLRSDKLRSGLAQALKLNDKQGLRHIRTLFYGLNHPERNPGLDYKAIVRRWQEALAKQGTANTFDLRVYEKPSFMGGTLLNDFCAAIGLLGDGETAESPPFIKLPRDVNPSISPAAQYIMCLAALFGLDENQRTFVRDILFREDNSSEKKLSIIPDHIAFACDKKFEEDDRSLAREFLGRENLFVSGPQFEYGLPSGESFIRLIKGIYEGRESLTFLPEETRSIDRPAVGITTASSPGLVTSQDIPALLNNAIRHSNSDRKDEAKACLCHVISVRPNHPRANYELAKIYISEGNIKEGSKHLAIARRFVSGECAWFEELDVDSVQDQPRPS